MLTLKKNHLLLNTKLKVSEKIIYYIDAILITCNIILVYKPFCSKTNSNFSVSHVMAYRFINLFAIRLIITLVFSIYVEAVQNLIWTNKPAEGNQAIQTAKWCCQYSVVNGTVVNGGFDFSTLIIMIVSICCEILTSTHMAT